ncbi:MAG TPA: hypothetical protein VN889_01580, partial [Solirubrobacteraceae bacterium]|nr:hypothetical protein [Solirubrobacteraceae bacterium]
KVAYPAADSEGPPAATEPANASIRSATPFSETGDAKLLLKQSSAAEAELSAASACHGAQAESDACFIGNLYRGTRALGVWVSGPVSVGDHVLELPIRLKGSSHPVGAYEGSVTLPGTSRPIKLKLTAEDGWWCAVIALLIGAGLALIGQLWNGHTRPKHALLARNRALISQYGADPLARHAHIRPDESDVLDYTEELQSAIRLYAASVVMLDEKSAAYAAIERALKLAEDDASVFKGALAPALDRLAAETQLTIKMLNGKQVSDVPQILRQAADLLGARELRVGEATQRAKQAEQLAPLLAAWRNLATRILTNAVWLKALEGKLRPRRSAQAKAELSELVYAGIELNAVRTSLFESTDEAELATIRTSVPLAQALGRIALTASRQDVKEPADNTSPSEVAGDLERVAYDAPQGSALTETTVEKARAKADVRRARPAALPSRRPWVLVGDSLVLLFTFGASIVAGLSTFYFNKTFGSAEDYLTVIVIGTAAQTLLKVVLNQTSVLLHDISPDMPVVPARVLPPAPAAAMALATPTGAGDGRRRRDAKLQTSDQVN